MNYVEAIGNESIFGENSYNICLTVMALKILDFLMSLPRNKSIDPLSKNKHELLSKENVGVLTLLLLV